MKFKRWYYIVAESMGASISTLRRNVNKEMKRFPSSEENKKARERERENKFPCVMFEPIEWQQQNESKQKKRPKTAHFSSWNIQFISFLWSVWLQMEKFNYLISSRSMQWKCFLYFQLGVNFIFVSLIFILMRDKVNVLSWGWQINNF